MMYQCLQQPLKGNAEALFLLPEPKRNLVKAQLLPKRMVRPGGVKLQAPSQVTSSNYLQHVEEQTPEFGSFHHKEGHFVTELGCCGSKAAVCHRFLVDGLNYLPQHLLRVGGVLGLLHEGSELGVNITAVVPHAVKDFN